MACFNEHFACLILLLLLPSSHLVKGNTSITSQPNRPSPAVFQSGENVTLTCSSSAPSPSYSWSTSFTNSDGVAAPVSSPSINGIYLHGANTGDHTCTVGDQTATYSLTVKGTSIWYKNPNPGHLLLNNTAISVYTYINEIRCYSGDTSSDNSATNIISPNDDSSAPLAFTNDEAGLLKKTGETTITTVANGVYTCKYVDGSGVISEISFAVYGRNREYNSDSNTGISLVVQSVQYTIDQENITVTCISSGWPATQVTWIRDGLTISSGATGYVMRQEVQDRSSSRYKNDLVIDNSISVLGTYMCEVKAIRHNDDIISSDTGLVNVQSAGSIFVVVTTMGSPEVGEDYHLNCTVTKLANETLSVVWLKDNVTITNSSADMTLGALENDHTYVSLVLSLSPVRLSHTGQYSCEARGSSDVGRATVQVSVEVPLLSLFLDPSDSIFTLGDAVTLSCSIGLPATLSGTVQSVTWYKDSTPLTNGVTNTLNDGLSTVDLGNILTDEAGNYTCMMLVISPYINNGTQLIISNSTNITVQLPLPTSLILGFTILSPPFYAGTDRDLQCRALINTYNDPHVTVNINILFDGSSIPTEFRKRLSSLDASENNIYGRTVLIQYLVASQDSGNYTCIATIDSSIESSYIIDMSVSTTQSFNIQAPVPIVDLTSSSNRIPFNASGSNVVSLNCSGVVPIYDDVFLQFPKTVAWSLDGSTIPGSPTSPTTPHQVFSNSLLEYSFSMAGSYIFTCRYSVSILGDPVATSSDTLTITVTPPSVPNPPINITATNIQYNRATINWILTDIAYTLESYVVYYGLTSDGLNETSSILNDGLNYDSMDKLLSIELINLEPDSMYYYVISSTNTQGSVNSSTGSFRTTEKPPTAPPEGFTMTTISSTSISFGWSPPALDHINGLLVSYTLNCTDSLSNDCPPPSNLSFPLVINQNSSVSITLDGFRPGTTVTCNVAASNQAGISPYATASAVTNEEPPSGSPQFSISTTEPREFTISWSPLSVCLRNGNITSYMFTCVEVDSNQVPSSHPISLVASPVVVGGLRPFTSYNCHLVAVNSAGQSDPVNMEGMTEPDVPTGSPRDFTFTSLNSTAIRLSWLPIDEVKQNGLINNYTLSCNHSDAPPILIPVDDSLETTRGYYTHSIYGLTPYTLYRCTIFADNTVGNGSIAVVSGRTNEDVPGDPPTITSLISYTPYSLTVKWLPPLTPNGIITHYTFYDVSSDPPVVLDVTSNPSQFEITGLSPYNLLTIRVSASTSVGEGPLSEPVTNRTLHTIPNPVQDVVLTPTSQFTLVVTVPEQPLSVANGVITEYSISIVEYTGINLPRRETVDATNDSIQVTFDELIPLIPYNVTVIAINMEGPGIPRTIIIFTKEGMPPKPRNIRVDRISDESMIVRWNAIPIQEAKGIIENYYVTYTPYIPPPDETTRRQSSMTVTVPGNVSHVTIDGLSTGVTYSVSVGATTGAGDGEPSDVYIVGPPPTPVTDSDNLTYIIIGVVVAVIFIISIIIIIIVVICIIILRKKSRNYNKHQEIELSDEKPKSIELTLVSDINHTNGDIHESPMEERECVMTPELITLEERLKPISVSAFSQHVKELHRERDKGFEQEYQSLNTPAVSSHNAAKMESNRPKNRFANIFPYDSSRVILKEIEGMEGSDYINASFMNGYKRFNAYIAAQGPLSNTVLDFWRMIWEQQLDTIVMLTKCVEAGKRKCELYWPEKIEESLEMPTGISVTLISITPYADFELKKFRVANDNEPEVEPIELSHWHFLGWPDHGCPLYATSLISFIRQFRKGHNKDGPPVLVHCSAGVGRTGTFILLDTIMERLMSENILNVYECLRQMRENRVFMVQTVAQYVFIHDALDELITCGETDISISLLKQKITHFHQVIPGKETTGFDSQFQLLEQVSRKPVDIDCDDALQSYNRHKNRYPDRIPYNISRARLRPSGTPGSEYINASFIDGYKIKNAYIATQGPLQATVHDFWRMVWEFKSKSIVLLTKVEENGVEVCYPYWPTRVGEPLQFNKLIVTLQSEVEKLGGYVVRKMEIKDDRPSPTSFVVTQFHFTQWEEHGCPDNSPGILTMIEDLNKAQRSTGNKPITVMCNDGQGRSGAFICIHAQQDRLKTEGVIDIFHFIKSIRIQRPKMVSDSEQYVFSHQVLQDYYEKFSFYSNFK